MITELTKIYLSDTRFKRKLTPPQALEYFRVMKEKGNIHCVYHRDEIIAYIEWFCVNADQASRLAVGKDFHIAEENITDGNICYVNDVYIAPQFRNKDTWKLLKAVLFERTKKCICYIGNEQKRNDRVRIRRRHG